MNALARPRIARRQFLALTAAAAASIGLGFHRGLGALAATSRPADRRFTLFAMDTGLAGPDVPALEDKVALLQRLGYAGMDYTLNVDRLGHLLELLDRASLELNGIYLSPALESGPDANLKQAIRLLGRRKTRIELAMRSARWKPSDPAGDEAALGWLARVSDWCGDAGPVVSIYPHTGLWTERVEDGVRLAEKARRANVGAQFNLVHWKWVRQDRPLDVVLKESMKHLMSVSINGLQGRQIVPLDAGDYDLAAFLQTLAACGYRGQIGLQGYGIAGPSETHLARSMRAWTALGQKISD